MTLTEQISKKVPMDFLGLERGGHFCEEHYIILTGLLSGLQKQVEKSL